MDGFWDWYFVGVAVGLGVTAGIPGLPREQGREFAVGVATVVAVAAGFIAALVTLWAVLATLLGLAIGVFSFRRLAAPAIPAATLAAAILALVPFLGYLEALLAPVVGARLRRRAEWSETMKPCIRSRFVTTMKRFRGPGVGSVAL